MIGLSYQLLLPCRWSLFIHNQTTNRSLAAQDGARRLFGFSQERRSCHLWAACILPKTVQGRTLATGQGRPQLPALGLDFPDLSGKYPQLKFSFPVRPERNRSYNHRREMAVDPGGDAPASPTGSPGRAETERQRRKALPGGRSRRTRLSFPVPERRLRRSATGSRRVAGSADRADLLFLQFRISKRSG